MKALIIAAGRGNRFDELTKDTPKAFIPLLGLSLIERVIFTTKEAGIREYVIVVGYLGERIKAILGNGDRFRVKINYIENEEWQKSNGLSVLKAKEMLNENFFLLISDHIFYARILKERVNYDMKGAVILAVDTREPLSGDTKVLEKQDRTFRGYSQGRPP